MDELETRELRYFIAVAEELHFGRAAKRLRIAQPALSKTVQRIETRLRLRLFDRTSRSVALTPAGEALLHNGRHALSAMSAAVQSAQRAAGRDHLRLVIKPGGDAGLLSSILAAYAQDPTARQVDILFSAATDRTDYLHDGRADAALLYAPFDDLTGLTAQTLRVEDRVVILPENHALAGRSEVTTGDLAAETFVRWRNVPHDYSGHHASAPGPELTELAELIPMVQIGRAIGILPRSLLTPVPEHTVCIPVTDAAPSRIVIARNARDDRDTVAAFIAAATAVAFAG